jgi:ABC-type multidrug transport system fused ATPase/permease subunit
MEKSIFRYIIKHSLRHQIIITVLAFASFPFLYAFYEVPKTIVNQAIQNKGKKSEFDIFGLLSVDQVTFLMLLCGLLLGLIVINQAFKYFMNTYQRKTGERMLRRLRFDLYIRVLRFPLPTFRRMSQGEVIPMITAEVEPLGGYIGDAVALPAFQGGQLLTILFFLLIQNWVMAVAACALYPLQLYLIPRLQRQVNQLGKTRVRMVRKVSERVSESMQGVQEIHTHDTAKLELADFSTRLGAIYWVRAQIYDKKFMIKFLNNAIQQLGPLFFYSIGGYLVITGSLDIGTLLAAIAAHKDLAAPWKELLNYYQMKEDARIKYEQVVSQFEPPGMRDERILLDEPAEIAALGGEIRVSGLSLSDEQGNVLLDGLAFSGPVANHVAIVGPSGSGKEDFALLLARLLDPTRGSINISGQDLAQQPEAIVGRRMAYVGQSAYIFNGSIGDNLYYGLKHRPLKDATYEGEAAAMRAKEVVEVEASGNLNMDMAADWIDYRAAGAEDGASLRVQALKALRIVEMEDDVYQLGLRGTIDPKKRPEIAEAILKARADLRARLSDPKLAALIEQYDRDRYNTNASVAENLLFGTPVGDAFNLDRLAENKYVQTVLEKTGLTADMRRIGLQVAETMVELFADLPPPHEFFQQFSFISAEELPEVKALLQRVDKDKLDAARPEDQLRLLSLPFKLIEARHRLGLIDATMQQRLLEARRAFAAELPGALKPAIEFFDVDRYNATANLQDNILFGKVAYGQAQAQEGVSRLIAEVVETAKLRDTITGVGLSYECGIAGARLTNQQRQKLGLARAVLKRPDLLILSEPTAVLDAPVQSRILKSLRDEFQGRGLIWALHRASLADGFDRVLVMAGGRLVEQGTYGELQKNGSQLAQLVAAE